MKRFSIMLITLVLLTSFSSCVVYVNDKTFAGSEKDQKQGVSDSSISRELALEIAFEKAGVLKEDVQDLEIELDRERGTNVWEISFDYNGTEYSYEVDAKNGAIEKIEKEKDLFQCLYHFIIKIGVDFA